MKLRFEVDQASCFRKGIDCPRSIVTIEVNPAEIEVNERNLIADRLDGIDVCVLSDSGTERMRHLDGRPRHVTAESPDYAGLMTAIRANQAEVEKIGQRHRGGKETFSERKARIENLRDAKLRDTK